MALFFCMINVINVYSFYVPFLDNYFFNKIFILIWNDIELLFQKNNINYKVLKEEKNNLILYKYISDILNIDLIYNKDINSFTIPALEINIFVLNIENINNKVFLDDFFDIYEDIWIDRFCFEIDKNIKVNKNIIDVSTYLKEFNLFYKNNFKNLLKNIDKLLIQETFFNNKNFQKSVYYMLYIYYIWVKSNYKINNFLDNNNLENDVFLLKKYRLELLKNIWENNNRQLKKYIETIFLLFK